MTVNPKCVLRLKLLLSEDRATLGSDLSALAGVGQPIPAEHTFAADRQGFAVWGYEFQKELEVVVFYIGMNQLFALPVHETDVHLMSVEVNSTVELRGGSVILHAFIK